MKTKILFISAGSMGVGSTLEALSERYKNAVVVVVDDKTFDDHGRIETVVEKLKDFDSHVIESAPDKQQEDLSVPRGGWQRKNRQPFYAGVPKRRRH